MKRIDKYDKWLKLMPWETEKVLVCPECNKGSIDYYFIGDLEKKIGFCIVWCDSCLKGINISRTRIPEFAKSMSFEKAENIGNELIPKIQFINME